MKKSRIISVVFVLCMAMLSANIAFAQGGHIEDRIRHQWHRIDHAVMHGRISDRDADFLRHHLRHIKHQFEIARDSGTLNYGKIEWLNRELDHNSARLERMEHGQRGGYGYR